MSTNPYRSPESEGDSPVRRPKRWKTNLLWFLGVIAALLMLGALLFPARRTARETPFNPRNPESIPGGYKE